MNLLIAQRKTAKDLERRRGLATAQLFQELRSNLEFKVPTVADLNVDSGPTGGGLSSGGAGGVENGEKTLKKLDGSAATAAFSESHATAWLKRLKKETHGSARDTIIRALSADVAPKSARLMSQVPKHLDYLTPLQQQQVLEVAAVAAPEAKDSYTELLTTVYLFQRNNLRLCENVLEAWYIATRQGHYERKRAAVGSALVWSDGARAGMLMEVRGMLLRARSLSWFSAPVRYPGLPQNDVRSTMPLMAPPELRGQTQEDFARLRDDLRARLSRMLTDHQTLLEEKQRVVVERWMFKEKTKDLRKVQQTDEEAKRQFEIAKKQVAEAPALLRLVEYMYTTHLAWSVENAAVFLSQTVMDTTQLQIPVMAIAQFKPTKGKAGGRSAPKLASSPSYGQVQAHLNSLLQAAINSAMAVVQICEAPLTNSDMADGDAVRPNPGCSRQAENLQLLIAASRSYRSSLLNIDAQLKQCFTGLDKSFGDVAQQLGSPQFLEYVTLMSEFYLDRHGLATYVQNAVGGGAGETGTAGTSSSSSAGANIGPSSVRELTMAEFLAFWCTGPQLDFSPLQEELRTIFLCAAEACAQAEASAPLVFKELPPNVAAAWSSQAAVAAKAWKLPPAATIPGTDTVCCTEFYDGVQVVMAKSSNLAEILAKRLFALGQFREGTGVVPQDLELVQAMCTWFRALLAQCLRWQESARHLRPSYQFGPLRVDMSFLSFMTAQVPAAMLSMCTYMLNLYAVQNARFICRGIQSATDEVEAEDPRSADVNREMRLRRVYAQIEEYKIGRGRLDAVFHALLAAVREPLLLDLTARLLGRAVQLDGGGSNPEDWQQKPEQPGVWHVAGALSVGALTLLLEVTGDTLAQLEVKVGNVVAAATAAVGLSAPLPPADAAGAPSAAAAAAAPPPAPLEEGRAVAAGQEAEGAAAAGPAFLTEAAATAGPARAPSRSQSVDVRAAVEQQLAVLDEVTHLARLPEKQRLANVERFARCKTVVFRRQAPSEEEEELLRLMPDSLARRKDVWEYTTCAICLTDFGDGEELSRAPCPGGHAFHPKCLRGWLDRSHTTCPVCRGGVGQDEDDDEAALAPTISSSSRKHVGPDALAEFVVRRMRSKKVDFTVSARNHRAAGQVLTQLREHRGLREEEPQAAEDSAAGAAESAEAKEAEPQSLLDRQPAFLEIFAARHEAQKVEADLRKVLSVRRGALRPGEMAPKRLP